MSAPELNREIRLEYLQGLKAFINLVKDPTSTDSVFDIDEGFRSTDAQRLAIEYMKSHPEIQPIVEEQYIGPTPDIEALLKLSDNSLGYVYASTMKAAGFDPEFYRKVKIENDATYITLRLRQTHDIWHMVTGFGTDGAGELGLQAFSLAQTHRPLSVAIMAGGILSTLLKSPDHLTDIMNILGRGYSMGVKAKPFLAQKWEEHWEKSLSEWRAELNVEPITASN